ncbi:MAG: FAD:protein FMN transferase, partial [Limisphaerales bacterium]
ALDRGINDVLVDFGADIRVHGQPPEKGAWHIGLEDPKNPGRVWVGVGVTNHAVATSGDYLRHFVHNGRRYGHILDPRTGYPVDNGILSVSIIAPHCTFAGILSTSVCVLGPQEGAALIGLCPGVEGCITSANNHYQTKGFYAYTTS